MNPSPGLSLRRSYGTMNFMRKSYGPLLIALAAFLWGLDGILRRSLGTLTPIAIVTFEHLAGLIVIAPFFLKGAFREHFTRREKLALLFVAALSSVLATLWFTSALLAVNFISFSVVFLIQKLQPIFAILGAAWILKEPIRGRYGLWAGLSLIAAYFVTFPGGVVNLSTGDGTLFAAGLALAAAFAWGFSTPFSRYVLLKHSSTVVTGWRFLLGFIIALLIGLSMGAGAYHAPTAGEWLRILAIALSTGMVALWIYYQGLRFTEARISAIVELIFPLTAVLIDILLYHTYLAWSQYLAAAVLVYTTWQVSRFNTAA